MRKPGNKIQTRGHHSMRFLKTKSRKMCIPNCDMDIASWVTDSKDYWLSDWFLSKIIWLVEIPNCSLMCFPYNLNLKFLIVMSYLHDLFFLDTFQFKFFHHNIYVKYRNYDYSEFRYINTLPIIFFLLLVKLQVLFTRLLFNDCHWILNHDS